MTGKKNKNDDKISPRNEVQCDSNNRRIVMTEKTNFTQAEDGLMAEAYEEYKKEDDDRVSGDDDILKQDSRLIKDSLMEKTKDPKVSVQPTTQFIFLLLTKLLIHCMNELNDFH